MAARPIRIVETAAIFKKAYKKKTLQQRETIDQALQRMASNLSHPSLRTHKMAGAKGVWEARASESMRITFQFTNGDAVRLRACCYHDIVYKSP